jgi:hypothetical protein
MTSLYVSFKLENRDCQGFLLVGQGFFLLVLTIANAASSADNGSLSSMPSILRTQFGINWGMFVTALSTISVKKSRREIDTNFPPPFTTFFVYSAYYNSLFGN